jgi:prolipoprotein diacylglyceryltransferase
MVAGAFFAAAWATQQELKRKEKQGLLQPEYKLVEVGKPFTLTELALAALTGFLLGFKIGGVFGHIADVSPDPMGYLLSLNGNLWLGIAAAALMGGSKWYEGKKQQLPEPVTKKMAIYPHDLIMEIVMVAAIGGFAGAKLFNAFETWDDFIHHPIQNLTSSSGLTFLGGLIVATISFYFFTKRHGIPFAYMADAAAPSIMLAYGVGRLGCQLAGDGDWGIYNFAYLATDNGGMRASTAADMPNLLHMMGSEPHAFVKAPAFLPDWLFGMTYPHNVGNEGRAIAGCVGDFCNVLPVSVFPTPIYEATTCILLFLLMWKLRPRLTGTLQMFGAYLLLAGVERFLVELIRVNYKYDLGFIHPTQAEILSVFMVAGGLWLLFRPRREPVLAPVQPQPEPMGNTE